MMAARFAPSWIAECDLRPESTEHGIRDHLVGQFVGMGIDGIDDQSVRRGLRQDVKQVNDGNLPIVKILPDLSEYLGLVKPEPLDTKKWKQCHSQQPPPLAAMLNHVIEQFTLFFPYF